jgi:hypothetical protein
VSRTSSNGAVANTSSDSEHVEQRRSSSPPRP